MTDTKPKNVYRYGTGIALGISFGVVFGLIFDNLTAGIAIGSVLGIIIDAYKRQTSKDAEVSDLE